MSILPYTKKHKSDEGILKYTLIIAITSIVANLFNYLFYFYMAKELGPEKYGIFGTMLSIYFVVFFLTNIMNYVIIEYISYFKAKIQFDKIRRLFDLLTKSMIVAGFLIFLLILTLSFKLKEYLKVDSIAPIIALGLFLWAYTIVSTFMGVLNGMQKFLSLGISRIVDGFFVLVLGIVFLGFNLDVTGSMLALFFAALLTIPFALFPLKSLFKIQPSKIGEIGMFSYVTKALVPSVFVALMLNIDVLLVKLLFSDAEAGFFAAASLMSKIIFFISTGILSVIFPKAAELHSNGEDSSALLKYGLKYTAIVGALVSTFYLLFPGFFAHVLFGKDYQIDSLIGIYALSIAFLSLTNVFVMYHLAIKKFGITTLLIPFAALEITGIILFNNGSLVNVLIVECIVMLLMFLSIVYFYRDEFIKMFKKQTGYRQYPISAFLRLKTQGVDDINSSSRKMKIREVENFITLDELEKKSEDKKTK